MTGEHNFREPTEQEVLAVLATAIDNTIMNTAAAQQLDPQELRKHIAMAQMTTFLVLQHIHEGWTEERMEQNIAEFTMAVKQSVAMSLMSTDNPQ